MYDRYTTYDKYSSEYSRAKAWAGFLAPFAWILFVFIALAFIVFVPYGLSSLFSWLTGIEWTYLTKSGKQVSEPIIALVYMLSTLAMIASSIILAVNSGYYVKEVILDYFYDRFTKPAPPVIKEKEVNLIDMIKETEAAFETADRWREKIKM